MHLSRRQRRRVALRFRAGAALVDLSTEFGVTVGQVRAILELAGEALPPADDDHGGLIDVFAPAN